MLVIIKMVVYRASYAKEVVRCAAAESAAVDATAAIATDADENDGNCRCEILVTRWEQGDQL